MGAHVAADQAIGAGRSPRQLAHDDARPQPTSSTLSPRPDSQRVEPPSHARHISRAAAFFEAGDAAEQRTTEGDRAMARRQCRDQRFPLALRLALPRALRRPMSR